MGGTGYRWYLAAQAVSLAGTMMGYTALFWLVLHLRPGGAPALAAVDAAQCLPMLLLSRRAGTIVTRHRAARVVMVTQALLAATSLAIGVPSLFPSWSVCSRIQRVPALRLGRPFLRRRRPTAVTSAV